MPPKSKTSPKPRPYPYEIPSIEYLKGKELKDASSSNTMEFFRNEALLRSKSLMELYQATFGTRPSKKSDDICIEQGILEGWEILDGAHHWRLLKSYPDLEEEMTGQPYGKFGIDDIQLYLRESAPCGHESIMDWLHERMIDQDSPFLWLQIDARSKPTPMCKKLKEMVKAKSEAYKTYLKQATSPSNSSSKTTSLDPHTWIDYFQCYDLRNSEAISYGQIATKVYGDSEKREVAEHAYKRVRKLIEYAESNIWPPPPNFLNKK